MAQEVSKNLVAALAKAQAAMPNALLNRTNPHFRNKYADLAALREASLPALNSNGLAVVQFTSVDEVGNLYLHTRLAHVSGEFIEGRYPLPVALDKPQAMGSALTYARRYGWGTIIGLASEDDDDAEVAQGSVKNGGLNTSKKSAYKAKKDGDWEILVAQVKAARTPHDLRRFTIDFQEQIANLPDSWKVHLREEYERKKTELLEGVTENGTVIEQLAESVAETEEQTF